MAGLLFTTVPIDDTGVFVGIRQDRVVGEGVGGPTLSILVSNAELGKIKAEKGVSVPVLPDEEVLRVDCFNVQTDPKKVGPHVHYIDADGKHVVEKMEIDDDDTPIERGLLMLMTQFPQMCEKAGQPEISGLCEGVDIFAFFRDNVCPYFPETAVAA